jgi:glycerol kinase
MRYVVAIDQGTTGTTVLVLDRELRVVGRSSREFPQIYPRPGWVEHDPEDIWISVSEALSAALRRRNVRQTAGCSSGGRECPRPAGGDA